MRRESTHEERNKKIAKMVEQEMSEILRKIDLEGLIESLYKEDITLDIICKLTIEDRKLKLDYEVAVSARHLEVFLYQKDTKQTNFRYQNSC